MVLTGVVPILLDFRELAIFFWKFAQISGKCEKCLGRPPPIRTLKILLSGGSRGAARRPARGRRRYGVREGREQGPGLDFFLSHMGQVERATFATREI